MAGGNRFEIADIEMLDTGRNLILPKSGKSNSRSLVYFSNFSFYPLIGGNEQS